MRLNLKQMCSDAGSAVMEGLTGKPHFTGRADDAVQRWIRAAAGIYPNATRSNRTHRKRSMMPKVPEIRRFSAA